MLGFQFSIVQFKIPQDVQLEDKIVGPLTLKQLSICAIGGTITYFFYTTLSKNYFWEVWILPVSLTILITLAISFIKISNVTFTKFILLLIEFALKPRRRIWEKSEGLIYPSIFYTINKEKKKIEKKIDEKVETSKEGLKRIEEISKILDSHGSI